MNIKLVLITGVFIALVSCKKETANPEKIEDFISMAETAQPKEHEMIKNELHTELYGLYNGSFIGVETFNEMGEEYTSEVTKKMSIKINRITKDSVYGQNIVNGNQRSFRGIYNEASSTFILDEPGDDKTDGRFTLKIKGDSLVGKWVAYKKTAVKSPEKKLKLIKTEFSYNPNFMLDENSDLVDWSNPKKFKEKYTNGDGKEETYTTERQRVASEAIFKINASKQKLKESELKNLRKLDLEIIKNAVYARHGYSFKKETFRYFFEQTDWYIPISNNVENDLTPLEKDNVKLLQRFIKYAEDKYDYFGR